MGTQVRTRTGDPFDFVDGLKIKGIDIASIDGAKQIGTYLTPTDTTPKILQTWINETVAAIASLQSLVGGGGGNATSPDQPLTSRSSANANTKFVQELLVLKLAELLDGAVAPLNTLKAIAQSINNDPNFYTTIANALASKATLFDLQTDAVTYAAASGTANAITASFTPAITTLTDGMVVRVRATAPNTGSVTFTPNNGTIPFYPVQKGGGSSLVAGDISMAGYPAWFQFDQASSRWVMINPSYGVQVRYASDDETIAGTITDASVTPAGLRAAIMQLVGSAPAVVDTITELAAAINNDPNFYTTITNALALKAPIASPRFTGDPKGVTKPATDSSDSLSTTAFVKNALALATQSGGVPNASTTTPGVSRYATVVETKAGTLTDATVTPSGLAAVTADLVRKDSPSFTTPLQVPTPPTGSNDSQLANTEFVVNLYNTIPAATTTIAGKSRYATVAETVAGVIENAAVTPLGLDAVISAISQVPQATPTVVGKSRLATLAEALANVNDTAVITPATAKAMIDQALAQTQPPPVFVAPVLGGASTLIQQKPYSLSLSATPVGGATNIVSFAVTVVNSLTGASALNKTTTVAATNNAATHNVGIAPRQSNSTLTITVSALDNTGKTSEVATKTVQAITVGVNAPVFSSPTNNQTGLSKTPTLAISGFGVSADADTHQSTRWRIYDETGLTLIHEFIGSTVVATKTSYAIPSGVLSSGVKYIAEAMFTATFYGNSPTTRVTFTVAAALVGELQKLTFPDAAAVGKAYGFGTSVALSADGTYLVVGAPGVEKNGLTNQGQACVFVRQGASYVHQATLNMDDTEGNVQWGWAVAIDASGTRCAVTSKLANELYGAEGQCQVFVRSNTTWSPEFKITPPVNTTTGVMESYIDFGHAVTMNAAGDTLAVAAPRGNHPTGTSVIDDAGYVYMYTRTGATWALQQRLMSTAQVASDQFGYDVDLSDDGNTLAVGNIYREPSGLTDTGSGAIFTRSAGVWTFKSEVFAPGAANTDWMGVSCAISGDGKYAIFGAVYDDEGTSNAGAVHVFFFNGTTWGHQAKLICSSPLSNSMFGASCSINTAGDKILVGASADTSSGSFGSGKAFLFKRTGTTWAQSNALSASVVKNNAAYGGAVDMSSDGNYAAVGASTDSNTSAATGSAYLLNI